MSSFSIPTCSWQWRHQCVWMTRRSMPAKCLCATRIVAASSEVWNSEKVATYQLYQHTAVSTEPSTASRSPTLRAKLKILKWEILCSSGGSLQANPHPFRNKKCVMLCSALGSPVLSGFPLWINGTVEPPAEKSRYKCGTPSSIS